jgi:hypothetical protein
VSCWVAISTGSSVWPSYGLPGSAVACSTNTPPGARALVVVMETLTPIYGPRPRCKGNRQRDLAVCANLSGFDLRLSAPSHHGYPPTPVLNNSPASKAMASNQATEVSVEPFLHSSFPSRKPRRVGVLFRLRRGSFLVGRRVLCGVAQEISVIITALCEHAPGYARKFCGQSDNQHIRVEPLRRCFQPSSEAVLGPALAS